MSWNRLLRSREIVVLVILVGLVAAVSLVNPAFARVDALLGIVDASLILILIAIGQTFVILTRGIDVSVGAIVGLGAVILGTVLNNGLALEAGLALTLVVGVAAGAINGVGVAFFRVPPIIMTLGTMGLYRGLMFWITDGSWIEALPRTIKALSGVRFIGVSMFAWVVLGVVVATAVMLRRLKQARYLYAVGDNEEGARLAGLPVRLTQFMAYALAGLFAGGAAILFVSQIGFVPMNTGSGQEMRAIAASVLGGVNLAGGVGTPFSAVVGGIFLTMIDSVLIYLKVPAFWNNAIAGAILLVVVLVDFRIRRAVEARQRQARARARSRTMAASTPAAIKEAS